MTKRELKQLIKECVVQITNQKLGNNRRSRMLKQSRFQTFSMTIDELFSTIYNKQDWRHVDFYTNPVELNGESTDTDEQLARVFKRYLIRSANKLVEVTQHQHNGPFNDIKFRLSN